MTRSYIDKLETKLKLGRSWTRGKAREDLYRITLKSHRAKLASQELTYLIKELTFGRANQITRLNTLGWYKMADEFVKNLN
jgi:hypothetical protein